MLSVAALAGGVAWLRASRGVTYYAESPTVHGIREGAPLQFRGVEVGYVERIDFTDSSIRFTLRVTRSDVPLRAGVRMRPQPVGIFGDYVAELVGGDEKRAPRLAPGAVLGVLPPDTLPLSRRLTNDSLAAALRQAVQALRQPRESTPASPVRRP